MKNGGEMRYILHSDLNNFYASVECLFNPEIRNKAVIVVGDVTKRHGVVLAKNYTAKDAGIAVGDTVWEAKMKCPDVVCAGVRMSLYRKISKQVKAIYKEYTQRVESFGVDEAWLDVTNQVHSFEEAEALARKISARVVNEVGLTVSIGVSFNKIFAKLGSDMKKPNGITVITPDNFKQKVWCLPAKDLLMVGRKTREKFERWNIKTIGDIARAGKGFMAETLGKMGQYLYEYASGLDNAEVHLSDDIEAPKSISRSTTTPINLRTRDEVRSVIWMLAEDVCKSMRDQNLKAGLVGVWIRDETLHTVGCENAIGEYSNITSDIANLACQLFDKIYTWETCVRAVGVRVARFDSAVQCSMFINSSQRDKQEKLEKTIDDMRLRYGYACVQRGIIFSNPQVGDIERE